MTVPSNTMLGNDSMRISAFWPTLIFLISDSWMLSFTCILVMSGSVKTALKRVDGRAFADLAARVVPRVVGIGDDAVLAGAEDGLVFLLEEFLASAAARYRRWPWPTHFRWWPWTSGPSRWLRPARSSSAPGRPSS